MKFRDCVYFRLIHLPWSKLGFSLVCKQINFKLLATQVATCSVAAHFHPLLLWLSIFCKNPKTPLNLLQWRMKKGWSKIHPSPRIITKWLWNLPRCLFWPKSVGLLDYNSFWQLLFLWIHTSLKFKLSYRLRRFTEIRIIFGPKRGRH